MKWIVVYLFIAASGEPHAVVMDDLPFATLATCNAIAEKVPVEKNVRVLCAPSQHTAEVLGVAARKQ
jgi:hypothetical protein